MPPKQANADPSPRPAAPGGQTPQAPANPEAQQIAALQTQVSILQTEVNISRADLTRALETIHSQQATIAAFYGNRRPIPGPPHPNGQPHHAQIQTPNRALPSGSDSMPIDRALREYCNVPGRWFFVASVGPEGEVKTFAPVPMGASSTLSPEMVGKFFSADQFKIACLKKEDDRASNPQPPEDAQLLPPPEGFYPTWDELFAAVRDFSGKQGYGVLHSLHGKRIDGTPCRYSIRCEKSGQVESKSSGKRKRETKKTNCPFDAVGVKYAGAENWKFKVNVATHNHPAYGAIRHVKKAEMEAARPVIERGVTADRPSKVIWEDILAAFPNSTIKRSDVNNMAAAYRRKMGIPPTKRPTSKKKKKKKKQSGSAEANADSSDDDDENENENEIDDAVGDVEESVLQQLGNQGRYSQPQTSQPQAYGQVYGQVHYTPGYH